MLSAKSMKCSMSDEYIISFIYNKNNSGPKMDPWGTPQVTKEVEEQTSL